MKQALLNQITPIIENFVDEILKSFGDIDKIRKDLIQKERQYQDLIEAKEKELAEIKKQKADSKAEIDAKITELENAKNDFTLKAKGYEDLRNELAKKEKEIEDNLAKSRIELIRAKDERTHIEKIKEDIESTKKNYELKLGFLKTDFAKLDEKQKAIDIENKKLKVRENEIFISETKQNQQAHELSDRELKLKATEAEVNRLIKRYKLEQSLKEQ